MNTKYVIKPSKGQAKEPNQAQITVDYSVAHAKAILAQHPQAFLLLDTDFRILDLNKKAEDFVKLFQSFGSDNLQSASVQLPPLLIESLSDELQALKSGKNTEMLIERQLRGKTGGLHWYQVSLCKVYEAQNEAIHFSLGILDLTPYKLTQEQKILQQLRFERLVNSQTHYVVCTDLEGHHTYWNKIFEEDYQWLYDDSGIAGANALISICSYHHAKALETVEKCISQPGKSFQVELDKPGKLGNIRSTIWEFTCATDEEGKPFEIQCTGTEVTQLRQLRESERLLNGSQQIAKMGSWNFDFLNDKVTWSDGLYDVFGVDRHTFKENYNSFLSLVDPSDQIKVAEVSKRTQEIGDPFHIQYKITTPSGERRIIEEYGQAEKDEQGQIKRLFGTAKNVTDRFEYEEKIKNSDRIFENASDMLSIAGFDGQLLTVNPAWSQVLGWSMEELLTTPLLEFVHPDDLIRTQLEYQKVIKGTGSRPFENRYRCKDGSYRWLSWNSISYASEQKIYASARDITESKAKDSGLQKMHVAMQQSPSTIVITDIAGNIEYVNPKFEQITGYSAAEVLGKNPRILKSGLQSAEFYQEMWGTLNSGKVWRGELCNKRKDGRMYWESATISPVFDEYGNTTNYLAIKEDITDQKADREMIAQAKERYQSIIEITNTGAWEYNSIDKTLWTSDAFFKMLGFNQTDIKGLRIKGFAVWLDLLHPEDRDKAVKQFETYLANKQPKNYENHFRLVGKNGQIYWIWSRGKRLKNTDGSLSPTILGTHIDISSLKAAEQKIKESELYYRTLLKAQPDLLFVINKSFVFLDYKAQEKDLYAHPHDFLGKHLDEVMPPENAQLSKSLIKEALQTHKVVESEFDLSINKINRHFNARAVAIGNEKVMMMIRDITESAENLIRIKKLLNQEEEQKKRLLNFTHIVSHNLRSHTANMQAILQLMDLEAPELLELEYIQIIRNSANNLNQTLLHLNEVLDISRNLESKFEPTSICKCIALALESVQLLAAEKGISIELHGLDDDQQLRAIPAYLDSIILNILTNAVKFSDANKAQSWIKVSLLKMPNCILISIADNGLGIDVKRHGDQIFGMYKTFHNLSDSKGLGLFITKNHVEAMGGQIKVKSRVGKGSIFKVYLPN